MTIKVFKKLHNFNAYILEEKYKEICKTLGIIGWEQYAFIGRFFLMDNDSGEHWMDNWELRESISPSLPPNLDESEILIIDPSKFQNKIDGPNHTNHERLSFWTDVLNSFHISLDTLINEARKNKKSWEEIGYTQEEVNEGKYIHDLEERIKKLKSL